MRSRVKGCKRKRCKVQAGTANMPSRAKYCKKKSMRGSNVERKHALAIQRLHKEENARFKRGAETWSCENTESEHALAGIRCQKVNVLSRACRKSKCSREPTARESQHVLASIRSRGWTDMTQCAFGCQNDFKKLLTPAIAAAAGAGFTWFPRRQGI